MRKKIFQLIILITIVNKAICGSLDFSDKRGLYDTPFQLTLTSDIPNATIYYTIDCSNPINGMAYSNPISINTTTVVKAIAVSRIDSSNLKMYTLYFQMMLKIKQIQIMTSPTL